MTHFDIDRPRSGDHIGTLGAKLVERLREIRFRRKLKRLADLDDHMLQDVGVTRGEIEVATSLPLSTDAATELRRMSLERRRRFM